MGPSLHDNKKGCAREIGSERRPHIKRLLSHETSGDIHARSMLEVLTGFDFFLMASRMHVVNMVLTHHFTRQV